MKTNAPKSITLLIAVLLVVLGVVAVYVAIPFVSTYAFYFVLAGFVVLLAGNLLKGL
jgi:uncharacterized membrane protein HdeD (DUF308 family)